MYSFFSSFFSHVFIKSKVRKSIFCQRAHRTQDKQCERGEYCLNRIAMSLVRNTQLRRSILNRRRGEFFEDGMSHVSLSFSQCRCNMSESYLAGAERETIDLVQAIGCGCLERLPFLASGSHCTEMAGDAVRPLYVAGGCFCPTGTPAFRLIELAFLPPPSTKIAQM